MSNMEKKLMESLDNFIVTNNEEYKKFEKAIVFFEEMQKQGFAQKRGNKMSVSTQSLTPQTKVVFNN